MTCFSGKNKRRMCLKYIIASIMLLVLCLCTGCGEDKEQAEQLGPNSYTVVDGVGNRLVFKEKPMRIVSMNISSDEMLVGLVPIERMVSVTNYADDPGVSNIVEEVKAVKNRVTADSIELLLATCPDVVVVSDMFKSEAIKTLHEAGINVYVFKSPKNYAEIKEQIAGLAAMAGEPEKGQEMIAAMDAKLESIKERVADIGPDKMPRVMFMSPLGAYYAPDSSFNDTCRLAHVIEATSLLGYKHACTLSQEAIVQINPDSFVISDWNHDGKHPPELLVEELLSNEAYKSTNAGKNKSIIVIPSSHMMTSSQHFVEGVEDLAKAVYPDRFKEDN